MAFSGPQKINKREKLKIGGGIFRNKKKSQVAEGIRD